MKDFLKKLRAIKCILLANTYMVYTHKTDEFDLFGRLSTKDAFECWLDDEVQSNFDKLDE